MTQIPDTTETFPESTLINDDLFVVLTKDRKVKAVVLAQYILGKIDGSNPDEINIERKSLLAYGASLQLPTYESRTYVLTLIGNSTLSLPNLPGGSELFDIHIIIDVTQDNAGNRSFGISNVHKWVDNLNPFASTTPLTQQFNKAANAESSFYFRSVGGRWKGSYTRYGS